MVIFHSYVNVYQRVHWDPTPGFRHKKSAEVVASPGASHASHAQFGAQLRRLEQQIEVRHQRSRGIGRSWDGFWCAKSTCLGILMPSLGVLGFDIPNRCSNVPSMLVKSQHVSPVVCYGSLFCDSDGLWWQFQDVEFSDWKKFKVAQN